MFCDAIGLKVTNNGRVEILDLPRFSLRGFGIYSDETMMHMFHALQFCI